MPTTKSPASHATPPARPMPRALLINLVLCALFAALNIILTHLGFKSFGQVNVVFTQVSIFLAAGLLGSKWGTLSQVLYFAMGAAGLPVFSNWSGGLTKVLGPTGGFLLGYILAAFVVGWLIESFGRRPVVIFPALLLGILLIYLPGLPWLAHVANLDLKTAFATGMLPYLPYDLGKVLLAGFLIAPLHKVLPAAPQKQ